MASDHAVEPSSWTRVLERVLDSVHVGVIVCDRRRRALAFTPAARAIVAQLWTDASLAAAAKLPDAVVRTVAGFDDEAGRARVEAPHGRAAIVWSVPVPELPSSAQVICLREEVTRDDELHAVLRSRFSLSRRGLQIVTLLVRGMSNKEIASELGLTASTVKTYVHQLFEVVGVRSRHALTAVVGRIRTGE